MNENPWLHLPETPQLHEALHLYEQFLAVNNYNLFKVKLLTALIFLNMAPLHHEPFNHLLHHLGKLRLMNIYAEVPTI